MARHVPEPLKNAGTVRYRCRTLREQIETLEASLMRVVWEGGGTGPRMQLLTIRQQLQQIEKDLPKILEDQARWREENPMQAPAAAAADPDDEWGRP